MEFDIVVEFAKFWECFDTKDLRITNSRKGVKSKCFNTYKKYVKDQEKADLLLFSLIEQKKNFIKCKELEIWVPEFSGVNPWLNGAKWEQELDNIEDLKRLTVEDKSKPHESKKLDNCNVEGCSREIHGPKFKKCYYHIAVTSEFKRQVKDRLIENGLMKLKSETVEEWVGRLRVQAKKDINRLKGKIE